MISIYDVNNTEYTKNGNAVLIPTECKLNVQINGSWSLQLTHPYDAEGRYKYIIQGAVIKVTDLSCIREFNNVSERTQLYRIYNYQRNINNVTATAFPLAMECMYDTPINSLNAVNKDAGEVIDLLQAFTNKYTLECNMSSDDKTWQIENTNLAAALAGDNSFINVYGGEILYDNLKIIIQDKLGSWSSDNWHPVYYGRNMNGIDYTKDESGVVTRLFPISKDGIKLNGSGKVDSSKINQYPFVRAKYIQAPYSLVDTSNGSDSNTAVLTRSIQSQIQTLADTLSHSIYNTAITSRTYEREYIKEKRDDIIDNVIDNCLQNINEEKLYSVMEKAINQGMKWMGQIEKASWSWHQNETGWWYGANDSDYAKNQWCYIDKKWRWFDADGYWVEKWDDASGDWDWIQSQTNSHWWFGNNRKYYAHDEWVYETVNGELKKYWIDEEGWYREEYTDVSDWTWHTWENGWWFGEEGATREETSKFAHDQWIWIDGNYYFFDSTGFYDGTNKIDNYDWDWQQDNQWFWFGNTDKSFGAQWLSSQWQKIDNKWYKFDSDGYMYEDAALLTACTNTFVTGMAQLKTLCETLKGNAYTLLYDNMTAYCQSKYTDGLDVPSVTINVNIVDLSKTSNYYSGYERICLGDYVECIDYEHDISTNQRIVGLTYDCIEGYNTNIVVGVAEGTVADKIGVSGGESQPSGGFDTSIIEERIQDNSEDIAELRSSKQDKLTAGTNITIDQNNVISAAGGGGTTVVANPSGSATDLLKKLQVGQIIYGLPYKELTQAEYDALPDTKLSDDVVYFIKRYEDHTIQDGQLTVRVFDDGTIIWYFNGYHWIDDGVGDIVIPDELVPFLPENPLGQNEVYVAVTSSYYADERHPSYGERDGWMGFRYNYPTQGDVYVMSYTQSWYSNNCVDNARLIVGAGQPEGSAGEVQVTEYIPPDEDTEGFENNKGYIMLNGEAYGVEPSVFDGATSSADGTSGLVPAPTASESDKFLKADGTWATPSGGGGGGSGSNTVLFTANSATSPMVLSDDLFDYDMLQINVVDGNGYTRGIAFTPITLELSQVIGFDNTYGYTWNQITSGTILTNIARSNFFIGSIVGVKYSDGGDTPTTSTFIRIATDVNNTDSATNSWTYVDTSIVDSGATPSNFVLSLKSLSYSGSNQYSCSTVFTNYSAGVLSYSWTDQSGSTRQWFDIYYIEDANDIEVLSDWTTYTTAGTYTFNIPSEAQLLTADDFLIDFKNVQSGGLTLSKTDIVKTVSNGVLSVELPTICRGIDLRIVYAIEGV